MGSWSTVPCLIALRDEFNRVAPRRDKGADGTIGDDAHKARSSDHNVDDGPDQGATPYEDSDSDPEVHALDVDSTGPWPDGKGGEPGGWYDRKIHELVAREKAEYEHPTIKGRLQNIIWRGRVWSRSRGWSESRPADGHFDHAHFSARYDSQTEKDTRPWGVAEEEIVISQEDIDRIADAVLERKFPAPAGGSDADGDGKWLYQSFGIYTFPVAAEARAAAKDAASAASAAGSYARAAHERANEAAAIAERIEAKVGEILSRLPADPPSQGQDGA